MSEHDHDEQRSLEHTTDPLLRTPDAARYIDMSGAFLAKARRFGRGPAYVRIGTKAVRYRRSALDAYLDGEQK